MKATKLLWIVLSGLVGLLVGAASLGFDLVPKYRATGLLAVAPAAIADKYVPSIPGGGREALMRGLEETVLSHNILQNLVLTNGFYADEAKRLALEELSNKLRENLEILRDNEDGLEVSFTYPDQLMAQKMTKEIMRRLLAQSTDKARMDAQLTLEFLQVRLERAASALAEAERDWKTDRTSNGRAQFNFEHAKDNYKHAFHNRAEAQQALLLIEMHQVSKLELIDPASYPQSPIRPIRAILLAGFCGGLLLGFAMTWWRPAL